MTCSNVCLISVVRLVSVRHDAIIIATDFEARAYWTAAEVNLAIVCACLSTLKPLLARVLPRLVQSLRDDKSDGSNPGIPFSKLPESSNQTYPESRSQTYYAK